MSEGVIEDNLCLLFPKQHPNSELVSIRKRLIAPNNILPGHMIRSQSPVHLLPVERDFQSQAGYQMLLDSIKVESEYEEDKLSSSRSKNIFLLKGKIKAESRLHQNKKKQNFNLIQFSRKTNKILPSEPNILQFLATNIRNILSYPQKIVFISKTAILNIHLLPQYKTMLPTDRYTNQQRKTLYLNSLQQNRFYGTIQFAFDKQKQKQINSLINYPNTDEYLQFSDNFESSNIYLAMRCDDQLMKQHRKEKEMHSHLYFLNVRLDYNTKSYGQWFYFKVKRKQSPFSFSRHGNNLFKFMIINMTKNSSLFGKGLKISVCRGGVWSKQGMNIRYYKNTLKRDEMPPQSNDHEEAVITNTKNQQTYYTLEFTLQICQDEQIYISYNEPYTFTRIGKVLDNLVKHYQENKVNIIEFKRSILCSTYLKNNIEMLTFTANRRKEDLEGEQKNVIFVMGRTHPIETAGSHVIEGIIHQLFSLFIENPNERNKNHPIYRLLQNFIIKIIPMTNPDGVILGNSRCNIAGYDLNRSWKLPRLQKCKEVYFIKKNILQYQKRIEMFIDLHAHSKKKNVFAYGCHDISDPYSTREFPYLLSKLSANDFIFQQCRFTKINEWKENSRRKKSKEGTARVFLYDTLKIPNVFTIQNSYCSAKNSVFHYDKSSYQVIGADILKAISLYFSPKFKKHEWAEVKNTVNLQDKQRKRFSNQSRIEVSLDHSVSDFELKLTINSPGKQRNKTQIQAQYSDQPRKQSDLRSKYLQELHQQSQNIAMGLLQDDPSESEQEKRIYQLKTRKNEKMNTEGSILKGKKQSKTQKLIHFLHKNSPAPTNQTSIYHNLSNLKFSNHNSQTSLAKITKITKDRFHTENKQIPFAEDQTQEHQEQVKKEKIMIKRGLTHKKKRQPAEVSQFNINKKEKFLSVVEIGVDNNNFDKLHDYRLNLIERNESKQRVKSVNTIRSLKNPQDQIKKLNFSEANPTVPQNREQQIKQYMRRLIKPKTDLNQQKKQKQQQRQLSKSRMYFPADLRHSKIIAFQSNKRTKFKLERTVL